MVNMSVCCGWIDGRTWWSYSCTRPAVIDALGWSSELTRSIRPPVSTFDTLFIITKNSPYQVLVLQLEGTRTHADEWLRHLANVNEARTKHPQNRRRLVTPPSECWWITVLVCKVLVCKMNLLTVTLTFVPQNSTTSRVSQGHSLHQVWTLWDHSFLSYAADRQTNRWTQKSYPCWPT